MVWIFYAGCAALSIWILPGKEEKLFTDKLLSDIYLQVLIITSMTVVGYIINKVDPTWGMTPFLVLGAILILTTVVLLYNENLKEKSPSGAIWHLVLSVPTFLYLWWLVALAFDLIFVWHLYIRQLNQLRHIAKYKDFANTTYSVS